VAVGAVNGRAAAVSGGGFDHGTLRAWDLETGQLVGEIISDDDCCVYVNSVAVGEVDGRAVAVSGEGGGTLQVWDLETGQPLRGITSCEDDAILGRARSVTYTPR
jgi:WD40 repeat protein